MHTPPFEPQEVIVGGPALGLWLQWQLAERLGVAAHILYPLPAGYIWSLARRVLKNIAPEDPLSLEKMTWRLYGALPELAGRPGFEEVRAYLERSPGTVGRFGLARRIADAFDRYLYYRPGLIRAFEQGEGGWQGEAWRHISRGIAAHRVAALDRLLALLCGGERLLGLPRRVDLFAVHTLPPRLMDVFAALSLHAEVHFWNLSPTEHYWADLVTLKARAKKRIEAPEEAALWETGNPLLASWGREGQTFQDLLIDRFDTHLERADHIPPQRTTLLGHIQADIFELQGGEDEPSVRAIPKDDSLQIHVCHSPLRECQVLYDTLLGLLCMDETLAPEDCLVMVPEIDTYAPYIEAVFGGSELPWHLADVPAAEGHPIVDRFLKLLELPESRFTRPEVLSYLDVPEIRRCLGFEDEEVEAVRGLVDRAQVFWGIDGDHKAAFGIPRTRENTWRQGRDRLFLGFALGQGEVFEGIAPVPVEGTQAPGLGKLWELIERLALWAERLKAPATGREWQARIGALLEAFFGEAARDPEGHLQRIREAIAALAEEAGEAVLDLPLVRHLLGEALAKQTLPGRIFQGGVTFCGLLPLRGVPFRVIALLGMNDGAFPRHPSPAEFDLMASRYRHGDPNPGHGDRFLLLESLLAARERLIISYTGRDLRTNEPIPPSALVAELLDDLDRRYRIDGQRPRAAIVREHPLQPWSPRNYTQGRSFHTFWCDIAQKLSSPPPQDPPAVLALEGLGEEARDITLPSLKRLIAHPIRGFVRSRLKIALDDLRIEPDAEPLSLDGLQRYRIQERLLQAWLEGKALEEETLRAEGLLPHGGVGGKLFREAVEAIEALCAGLSLGERRILPIEEALSDRRGRAWRITGRIPLWGERLLRIRPGQLRAGDVLGLWCEHLLWCLAEPGAGEAAYRGKENGRVRTFRIPRIPPDEAREALADLLDAAWEALHQPLPLPPKTAWAFYLALHKGQGLEAALEKARSAFEGGFKREGEGADAYTALFMRGREALWQEGAFQGWCERLLGPPFKRGTLS